MHALLLITAANESSKVPFYIIGGGLAVFAVILSTIGIQRPDFPSGARGQRGVIAVTAVFALVAIVTAVLTS